MEQKSIISLGGTIISLTLFPQTTSGEGKKIETCLFSISLIRKIASSGIRTCNLGNVHLNLTHALDRSATTAGLDWLL